MNKKLSGKKKQYFTGLEDLPKTICDTKGHKPTAKQFDGIGWISGCKRCTCIIYYGNSQAQAEADA